MNPIIISLKYVLTLLCCCNSQQNNYQVNNGSKEFVQAIKIGDLEKVKFFVQKEGSEVIFQEGGPNEYIGSCKPIHIAAMGGQLNIIKYLIKEEKVEFDAPCETYNRTPLIYAIQNDNEEVIKYLISKGAKINVKSEIYNQNKIPLHEAIRLGNLKIVKLLVKSGANIEIKNFRGDNTADIAVNSDKIKIIKYILLKNNAFSNKENNILDKMLKSACLYKKPKSILYLLEQGAKIEDGLFFHENSEIEDYLKELKILDNFLKIANTKNLDKQIEIFLSKVEEKIKNSNQKKQFISLIFRRYMNLLDEDKYYDICSKILSECKKNDLFGDTIKNHLQLKNLEEHAFYTTIKNDLNKNCIHEEKVRKVSKNFNKEEFKRNLLNSKVKTDVTIRFFG